MGLETIGGRSLPADGNVPKGYDAETAALIAAVQDISKMVQRGAGEPFATIGAPAVAGAIYINTAGTSVNALSVGLSSGTWGAYAQA